MTARATERVPTALILFMFGCGGVKPGPGTAIPPAARECSAKLAPRSEAVPALAATEARRAPLSQIVVHGEAPLSTLQDQLERRIPRRLAAGRFSIGPAGSVSYSAERGGLALSVVRHQLVVQTPVHARAEACRGGDCYASCEPEAIATAQVPLLLQPDYDFDHATLSLHFTHGCKIKALGGFLTVDVTPTLESALEPELAKVTVAIDKQLYNLREDTERAWGQLSAPRELPLGGCLVLQPQGIVQGPLSDSSTLLHARFAVLARPELRTSCAEPPRPLPLPALERNLGMPNEGEVTLGIVSALSDLQRAFASTPQITVDGRNIQVKQSTLTTLGSDVVVTLTLGGDLCGEATFVASPSFAKEGAFIGLTRPYWPGGEGERVAAQELNPDHLLQALAAAPHLTPLLAVTTLPSAVPPMVKLLSTPSIEFAARVSSAQGAGAAARDDRLIAWIAMLGRLDVKAVKAPM